jgi:alanine-synthesizing transaminase
MLSNMRLCANVPGQWAIQTALGGYQSINDLTCEGGRLRRQRDLAYELITAIPGVTCVKPSAALYMFPRLDPEGLPDQGRPPVLPGAAEGNPVMLVQGTGFNWASRTTSASCSCRTRTTCARPSTASRSSSSTTARRRI